MHVRIRGDGVVTMDAVIPISYSHAFLKLESESKRISETFYG